MAELIGRTLGPLNFGTVDYRRVAGELIFGIYDAQGQVVYQLAGYERAEWTLG